MIVASVAAASEPSAEAATGAPRQAVPRVPVVEDMDALDRVELRREIARAEGRLSDLRKEHVAAMRGLDAAAERSGAEPDGSLDMRQVPGQPAPDDAAEGRRAELERERRRTEALFERDLAEARNRLDRLLDRQARIDPAAMDQTRLRAKPSAAGEGAR